MSPEICEPDLPVTLSAAVVQCLDEAALTHLGHRFGLAPAHLALLTREVCTALMVSLIVRCCTQGQASEPKQAPSASGQHAHGALDDGADAPPAVLSAATVLSTASSSLVDTPGTQAVQRLIDALTAPGIHASVDRMRDAWLGSTRQLKQLESVGHAFFAQASGLDTAVLSDVAAARVGVPTQASHAWTGLVAALVMHVLRLHVVGPRVDVRGPHPRLLPLGRPVAPADFACLLLAQWSELAAELNAPLAEALGYPERVALNGIVLGSAEHWLTQVHALDVAAKAAASSGTSADATGSTAARNTSRAVVAALVIAVPLTALTSWLLTRAGGEPAVAMQAMRAMWTAPASGVSGARSAASARNARSTSQMSSPESASSVADSPAEPVAASVSGAVSASPSYSPASSTASDTSSGSTLSSTYDPVSSRQAAPPVIPQPVSPAEGAHR